jgi:hypothetical protein
VVPAVKPVIVSGPLVITGDAGTQLLPLSKEYSKLVIAEEPVFDGAMKDTLTVVSAGVMLLITGVPGVRRSEELITRFDPSVDAATNVPFP